MLTFEKRESTPLRVRILVPLGSVVLGLVIGAVVMLFSRINPIRVYAAVVKGSVGSWYAFTETVAIAIPLILIATGLALVFRMRFLNIGAMGQYIIGALCGSWFALFGPPMPRPLLLTAMMLAGAAGGAIWAVIPALLKVKWQVNEVIATLLLNYVAEFILKFLIFGIWRDPFSYGFPLSKTFAVSAQLPRLFAPPSRVHVGLVFALVAACVVWVVIRKTRFGYEGRVIGENDRAARYAGINIVRTVLIAAAVSGGLAGLAGIAHIAGYTRLVQQNFGFNWGYTAIIVTWLASLDPLIAIGVAMFLACIEAGGYQIQIAMRVPFGIVSVIESSILFALLACEILTNYRVRLARRSRT
jgi:ABC-type uncharacterized transport system permease subunit